MRRLVPPLSLALFGLLLAAPSAIAGSSGEGLYGPADDKVVTNAGFIIIAVIPLFIFAMSMLQWRLDKRKQARTAAAKARASSAHWRGGW